MTPSSSAFSRHERLTVYSGCPTHTRLKNAKRPNEVQCERLLSEAWIRLLLEQQ